MEQPINTHFNRLSVLGFPSKTRIVHHNRAKIRVRFRQGLWFWVKIRFLFGLRLGVMVRVGK